MKKQIRVGDKKINYTHHKSRRTRRMRLVVFCGGDVILTTPFNVDENIIEKFIIEKIDWLLSKISYFKKFKMSSIVRYNKTAHYLQNKEKTLALVKERIEYFNKDFKYHFNKISIRNQKTRWGSCSRKGNLSFNYKIVLLPEKLSDYIIVHELCHLKEFNHSLRFWKLVAKTAPDYLEIRRELKKSGIFF